MRAACHLPPCLRLQGAERLAETELDIALKAKGVEVIP